MGRDVSAITVSMEDRRRYREKVQRCLEAFAAMLRESRFASDPPSMGMEIELNLVDEAGRPAMRDELAGLGGEDLPGGRGKGAVSGLKRPAHA